MSILRHDTMGSPSVNDNHIKQVQTKLDNLKQVDVQPDRLGTASLIQQMLKGSLKVGEFTAAEASSLRSTISSGAVLSLQFQSAMRIALDWKNRKDGAHIRHRLQAPDRPTGREHFQLLTSK